MLAWYYLFYICRGQFHSSATCVTEGWLFQTSLQKWTNVMKNLSTSKVRRRPGEAGLNGRTTIKKPLLRERKQCQKASDWTIAQWNKVFWTDESKFEIFRSNRKVYVQRRVGKRVAAPCITLTVKHGGCFVMVWEGGAFANCKVTYLHQEKEKRWRCVSRVAENTNK